MTEFADIVMAEHEDPIEESVEDMQGCQPEAKTARLSIDLAKCAASSEGVEAAELNKGTEFVISLTSIDGGTKEDCVIKCHLESLVNGSIIECDVDLIHSTKYHVTYTPTLCGRHELIVSVNRQEVAGSPFPVFVSIPPTQLDKPVRVIDTGDESPWHAAVNSEGETIVIVTGKISKFDKEGRKLKSIRTSYFDVISPSGVAVDITDCVYIAENHKTEQRHEGAKVEWW